MVDERALAIVQECLRANVWTPWPLMAKRVIEAYEAARWRPIVDAPRDGNQFLVWLKADSYPKLHLLHWDAYDREFHDVTGMCWSEHGDFINGAMFRTIDPPKQDAVSRVTQPTKNERG